MTSRDEFETIDLAPYATAIRRHGVGSVMPSFSSVDWIEDGVGDPVKMHAHEELITDVLKGDSASVASSSRTGRASTRSRIPTIPATVG